MNYKNILLIIPLLFNTGAYGQILEPATWKFYTSRQQVTVGDTLDLVFIVEIAEGWYLYSNDFDPELGPMLTEFKFGGDTDKNSGGYELIGKLQAIGAKRKYDPVWDGEISYFEKKAVFRQTIRVTEKGLLVKGQYSYQVCSNIDGKCIGGYGEFVFNDIVVVALENRNSIEHSSQLKSDVKKAGKDNPQTGINSEDDRRLSKWDWVDDPRGQQTGLYVEQKPLKNQEGKNSQIAYEPETATATINTSPGLWQFAFLAFMAGLAALLTPCVFPMVPMTVTFFTHQNQGQAKTFTKAISYGLSIILIYTLAGTMVAWVNGPAFANWLSTHWLPNLFFFAIFVFFALSFLGMFEITLPSGLVNSVDRQSDKSGWKGIFFMAFTLVLVSFSCTGPIVGALLVASAGGEVMKPVIGMASFALALAMPFTLFAAFPQWMKKLPKSGNWLNAVKVVLGFLELALGLKFLSVADQVYHWGILDREIYLALWIVIFSMIGFYLLGKIKLPHDNPRKDNRVGVPRLILALLSFAFVIYLVPGMLGAPLKALAGYLPPMSTHDFNLFSTRDQVDLKSGKSAGLCEPPKYAEKLHFPHGIQGYFDLDQAVKCAMQQNKPLFIDFTGHGCVNCREMEARVWSDPKVLQRLKQDFVLVALYVDEKEDLPEKEWYRSTFDGKIKKSIGDRNADFQITRFNNNAQPFYVILDPFTMEVLGEPQGYGLDIKNFVKFLAEGKERFGRD